MELKFTLNYRDYFIFVNLNDRKPYSDCDEVIEGVINEEIFYRVFFGIDEESGVVSNTPCCIDVFDEMGFCPIYDFEIIN